MNKMLLTLCFLLNIFIICIGQEKAGGVKKFSIVCLPDFYKEKGVVFNKDYKVGIDIKNFKSGYNPSVDDIDSAERIFVSQFNKLQGTNIDVRKEFLHYVRQYLGVIQDNGDRKVIVQFIDNSRPGKIRRLLGKNWETDFVVMLGDDFYSVSTRFSMNIDKGEMSTIL